MDIESSAHSQPGLEAEMEVESNNRQEKESPPAIKKPRRLEKQIEKLKEELMEANMLEKVIKRENEMLRTQSKETQQKNEKLKEQIQELKAEQTDLCKWATKWYTQKKALKEKYKCFWVYPISHFDREIFALTLFVYAYEFNKGILVCYLCLSLHTADLVAPSVLRN